MNKYIWVQLLFVWLFSRDRTNESRSARAFTVVVNRLGLLPPVEVAVHGQGRTVLEPAWTYEHEWMNLNEWTYSEWLISPFASHLITYIYCMFLEWVCPRVFCVNRPSVCCPLVCWRYQYITISLYWSLCIDFRPLPETVSSPSFTFQFLCERRHCVQRDVHLNL